MPWGRQSGGIVSGRNGGAATQEEPMPEASAASMRFCPAMATLWTAIRYWAQAASGIAVAVHVLHGKTDNDDRGRGGDAGLGAGQSGLESRERIAIGEPVLAQTRSTAAPVSCLSPSRSRRRRQGWRSWAEVAWIATCSRLSISSAGIGSWPSPASRQRGS